MGEFGENMGLHRVKKKPLGQVGSREALPLFRGDYSGAVTTDFGFPQAESDPELAYRLVHDLAIQDGNAQLNLATFVSTWMDDHAAKLYEEAFDKNMIDKDEYPRTAMVEAVCVNMLAELWHAPDETIGTSTIGSSEACMLAGLAFKRRWRTARLAVGESVDKPNLIMSSAVQVVWEKFCNYWDVEARYAPVTLDTPTMTAAEMLKLVDENTIGVVGIMGVTYTGLYEPIEDLARALDDLQVRTGLDVPLHVDGASGGFVAPFLQPDLRWDFRLDRVHSINTSGHKYGLVYPGLGWIIWRKPEYVPEDLIFHVSYLGGDMPTLALNFSRPGAQVLLQAYMFAKLGRDGYRRVLTHCQDVALALSSAIGAMPQFELLSRGDDIPVFAWRLRPDYTDVWDLEDLSERLRFHGWQVPAYPMPDDISDIWVMRIVVRHGFTPIMAQMLLDDLRAAVTYLDSLPQPLPRPLPDGRPHSFAH